MTVALNNRLSDFVAPDMETAAQGGRFGYLISVESQLKEPVRAERSLRQQAKSKRLGGDTLRLRRYAPSLRANGG